MPDGEIRNHSRLLRAVEGAPSEPVLETDRIPAKVLEKIMGIRRRYDQILSLKLNAAYMRTYHDVIEQGLSREEARILGKKAEDMARERVIAERDERIEEEKEKATIPPLPTYGDAISNKERQEHQIVNNKVPPPPKLNSGKSHEINQNIVSPANGNPNIDQMLDEDLVA